MYRAGGTGSPSYAFSALALALATKAGYADGAVTVTGISDTFGGVIIDEDRDYLDFLTSNRELLNCEVVQDQTIRVFRIPDNPSVDVAITTDLCIDDGRNGPVTVQQEQESSFASLLDVKYRDAGVDYAKTVQPIKRPRSPVPVTASLRKDTIESDLIMTATQAVTLGTQALYRRIAGSTKATLSGMPALAAVAPGDVVSMQSGANSYKAKVKQNSLGGSLQNRITVQAILTHATYAAGASDSGDSGPFTVTLPDPASTAVLLDGPLLKARDDLGGLGLAFRWIATSRGQDNWGGAQFFYGFDNVNFIAAAGTAVTTQTVLVGTVLAALPDNPLPFMTDYTNSITIVPRSGDFSGFASVTYAQMMDGDTLAYIGAPGRWEVIGWETFTANADGTYTFAGLARGLFGTEAFSGSHVSGDLFVPITGADINSRQLCHLEPRPGAVLSRRRHHPADLVGAAAGRDRVGQCRKAAGAGAPRCRDRRIRHQPVLLSPLALYRPPHRLGARRQRGCRRVAV
jgi:hypothetical protein